MGMVEGGGRERFAIVDGTIAAAPRTDGRRPPFADSERTLIIRLEKLIFSAKYWLAISGAVITASIARVIPAAVRQVPARARAFNNNII